MCGVWFEHVNNGHLARLKEAQLQIVSGTYLVNVVFSRSSGAAEKREQEQGRQGKQRKRKSSGGAEGWGRPRGEKGDNKGI